MYYIYPTRFTPYFLYFITPLFSLSCCITSQYHPSPYSMLKKVTLAPFIYLSSIPKFFFPPLCLSFPPHNILRISVRTSLKGNTCPSSYHHTHPTTFHLLIIFILLGTQVFSHLSPTCLPPHSLAILPCSV